MISTSDRKYPGYSQALAFQSCVSVYRKQNKTIGNDSAAVSPQPHVLLGRCVLVKAEQPAGSSTPLAASSHQTPTKPPNDPASPEPASKARAVTACGVPPKSSFLRVRNRGTETEDTYCPGNCFPKAEGKALHVKVARVGAGGAAALQATALGVLQPASLTDHTRGLLCSSTETNSETHAPAPELARPPCAGCARQPFLQHREQGPSAHLWQDAAHDLSQTCQGVLLVPRPRQSLILPAG